MKIKWLTTIILTGCFFSSGHLIHGQNQTLSIVVNPDKTTGKIDVGIYGQFLEHLYHSVNGGIWGDVVWNRSFEEMPPRPRQRDGEAPEDQARAALSIPRHWIVTGKSQISSDTANPLNSRQSVKIIAPAAGSGISQDNFCVRREDALRGSVWLRGTAPDGIVVRLVNGVVLLAEQRIEGIETGWKEIQVVLDPSADAKNATLQITARGKAEFNIDQVSLMPDSYRANGGFRTDLLKAVADLKPASIRWPGGSFMNGYLWKDAIGPQAQRRDKGRVQWDEIDPLSFGIDEFVAFCRKVGAEPVVVLYIGPRNQSEPDPKYIQDGVDLLEYCNGPATSDWGKLRAQNGHPEPYNIKYWEIDNEIYLTQMPANVYLKVAQAFADALTKKDPSITFIGCGGGGTNMNTDKNWQLHVLESDIKSWDLTSIHSYANYAGGGGGNKSDSTIFFRGVESFEKHFADYRKRISESSNPDMKLYLSEWNYMSTDLRTGLYAGGLLNVMERNSDIVKMACPALWLRHTTSPAWDNAFINFDNCSWFPAPNYVVMKLWRDHFAPDRIDLSGETGELNLIATRSEDGKKIYIKAVNPTKKDISVQVSMEKKFKIKTTEFKFVSSGAYTDRNTMEKPDLIKPVSGNVTWKKNIVSFDMPRWSAGVVTIENKK